MLGLLQYSAANACVQGGLGRLLGSGTWDRLLRGNSLDEMIGVLSPTVYRDAVVEAPHNDIGAVEMRLRRLLAARMRLPVPFLRGAARRLVERLWQKFEVDNLIAVLRARHSRDSAPIDGSPIDGSLIDLGPASRLDWEELRSAGSVAAAIDRIVKGSSGQEYGRALENAMHEYRRRSAVYLLEVSLYLDYYRKLGWAVRRLWGRDRQAAGLLVGNMIDFCNLHWAYRYRTFFQSPPESILSYTLPESGRVDFRVIQRIATGAPLIEVLTELWGQALPGLERIVEKPAQEAVVELEIVFRRYLYREAKRMLTGYPLHLGMSLAYIVLLEAEVDDLIAVIECRLNGWPAERIRLNLIGERGTE